MNILLVVILKNRYLNYVNPVWKITKQAETIESFLKEKSTILINCYEVMMDNIMVGNLDKFPEFEFTIFLISLNLKYKNIN